MDSLRSFMKSIKTFLLKNPEIDSSSCSVNFVGIQNDPFPAYLVEVHTRWTRGPAMIADDDERNSWSWFREYMLVKEEVYFRVCEIMEDMGLAFAHPTRFNYNRDHVMKQQEQLRLISTLKGTTTASLSLPKKPLLLSAQKKVSSVQGEAESFHKLANMKEVERKLEEEKTKTRHEAKLHTRKPPVSRPPNGSGGKYHYSSEDNNESDEGSSTVELFAQMRPGEEHAHDHSFGPRSGIGSEGTMTTPLPVVGVPQVPIVAFDDIGQTTPPSKGQGEVRKRTKGSRVVPDNVGKSNR